jgi:WD40 repeat protein
VAFSPDGTQIASLTRTGNAAIWDSRTGRLIRELDDTGACVYSIDWSADGQWLACLDGRGNLWVCAAKHGAWSFVAPRLGDLDSRVYFTGPSRISVVGRGVVRTVELPAARRADN